MSQRPRWEILEKYWEGGDTHQNLLEEFIDEKERWMLIGLPSRNPFSVLWCLERHSVRSEQHLTGSPGEGEGLEKGRRETRRSRNVKKSRRKENRENRKQGRKTKHTNKTHKELFKVLSPCCLFCPKCPVYVFFVPPHPKQVKRGRDGGGGGEGGLPGRVLHEIGFAHPGSSPSPLRRVMDPICIQHSTITNC